MSDAGYPARIERVMDDYAEVDAAHTAFRARAKRRDFMLDACAAEQASGRTGLVKYLEPAALQAEVNAFAGKLAAAVERERVSL